MSQHVSIEGLYWKKISEDKKEDLWNIIKGKFSFAQAETKAIRNWVMSDMASKLKSWKYELKRNSYDPALSIDDIVAVETDSTVDKVQFKKLVTHWFNKKSQVKSEMKKRIRFMSNDPHVTGTKSFARLIHEETKKNNGIQPSRGRIHCISRTRKNGMIVNATATEIVDKLKTIMDGSTSSTKEGIDWTNDDLAKVKGPKKGGQVRCLGKVRISIDKGLCSLNDSQVPLPKARINELEEEMKERNRKQEAELKHMKQKQDAEIKDMKETMQAMTRFMETVKKQLPIEVANDSFSVFDDSSSEHPTSSRTSEHHNHGSRSTCKG